MGTFVAGVVVAVIAYAVWRKRSRKRKTGGARYPGSGGRSKLDRE